jgi:polysaccharide export outer membrane protein
MFMTTGSISRMASANLAAAFRPLLCRGGFASRQALLAGLVLFSLAGCATVPSSPPATPAPGEAAAAPKEEVLALKPGDVLKISFPGAPSMDSTQPIRPDGRISLPMAGDFMAAGQSTDMLTTQLKEAYANKLVSNEVTVSLVSATYTVYVTGAVLRPGKIVAERRITVFDAIMEAGGFDKAKANLKAVVIVRQENGQSRSYTVNVQKMLSGDSNDTFYLKPFDTVYVNEKFSWF